MNQKTKTSGNIFLAIFFALVWIIFILIQSTFNYKLDVVFFLTRGILPIVLIWGSAWLVLKFFKKKQPVLPLNEDNDQSSLNPNDTGIYGWLILPAITVVLTPILLLTQIIQHYQEWSNIVNPNSFQIKLYLYIGFNFLLLFPLSIIVLITFYQKKKNAPRYVITYYITGVVLSALAILVTLYLGNLFNYDVLKSETFENIKDMTYFDFFKSLLASAVWIPYFLFSKRVKRTFVK